MVHDGAGARALDHTHHQLGVSWLLAHQHLHEINEDSRSSSIAAECYCSRAHHHLLAPVPRRRVTLPLHLLCCWMIEQRMKQQQPWKHCWRILFQKRLAETVLLQTTRVHKTLLPSFCGMARLVACWTRRHSSLQVPVHMDMCVLEQCIARHPLLQRNMSQSRLVCYSLTVERSRIRHFLTRQHQVASSKNKSYTRLSWKIPLNQH